MSDTGTITSTMIADGTIANADLADGAVSPIKVSGGYVAKTALYTATNDDRVIDCTSGTYTITLPTAVAQAGRIFIVRNSGSGVITIGTTSSQTIDGAATITLSGKGFAKVVSDGSNWRVIAAQYADESVGRRIFTWNHAYSTGGGFQQTYGDTGLRNITADLTFDSSFWVTYAPAVYVRRINANVTISCLWVVANPIPGAAGSFFTLPVAYRPSVQAGSGNFYGSIGNASNLDTAQGNYYITPSTGVVTLRGLAANNFAVINPTYVTDAAWPTSLGGSAVGSIPT